jgi:hypothetical protein
MGCGRRVEVALMIADDELIAVEDANRVQSHGVSSKT